MARPRRSSDELYFSEAGETNDTTAQEIYKIHIKDNDRALVKTTLEGEKRLLGSDSTVFFVSFRSFSLGAQSYPCEIMRVKVDYSKLPVALPFPTDSPYLDIFSDRLRRIDQVSVISFHTEQTQTFITSLVETYQAMLWFS